MRVCIASLRNTGESALPGYEAWEALRLAGDGGKQKAVYKG